jgi:hypothetical protein
MAKYKLGSQIDLLDNTKFEYNLCWLNDRGEVISYIYLGVLNPSDDIIRTTRDLVNLLNKKSNDKEAS